MSVGDIITSPNTGKSYTLDRRLGAGGFGTVFSATDQASGDKVAIKISILKNAADPYYLNEITAFNILSKQPNCQQYIVCLYDDFRIGNVAYEIQELMDGDLKNYRPGAVTRVAVLKDLLAAIEYIHSKNLAHQDIKPENTLRKGSIFKMGDPGLVCSDGTPNMIKCGGGAGTPNYLAPEAFTSNRFTVKKAQFADVWSLGATFFVMFTGRLPYSTVPVTSQSQVETLKLTEDSGLVKASSINNIVNAMLRVNPAERQPIVNLVKYLNKKLAVPVPPATEGPGKTPNALTKGAPPRTPGRTPGVGRTPKTPGAPPAPQPAPLLILPPQVEKVERVENCIIEDDLPIAPQQLSSILTSLGVAHNPLDNPTNLCNLIKENYPCNLIQGVPVTTDQLRQIATLYGLDASGSRAKLCKTITRALATQGAIDKRRVSTILFEALKEATEAQLKGNAALAAELDARIRSFIALGPQVIDKSYLEQQYQLLQTTITQAQVTTRYNTQLRDNLLATAKLIP